MKNHHKIVTTLLLAVVIAFGSLVSFSCKPKSISLDKESITLGLGDTETLVATIQPANIKNNLIIWTSSNPLVASVKDGVVTGEAAGEAVVTATSSLNSALSASCKVFVKPVFYLRAKDVTVSNLTFKSFDYKIFPSEADFLARVSKAYPVGTDLTITDFIVSELSIPDNSFLKGLNLFSVGSPLPTALFGVQKTAVGVAERTYSKEFSFMLSAKGVDIPFQWKKDDVADLFTLPKEGEILLVAGDFELIPQISSMKVVFHGLKTKVVGSFSPGSETGAGTVSIGVDSGSTTILPPAPFPISDLIELTFPVAAGTYQFSFPVTLTLTSGKAHTLTNNVSIEYVHNYVSKELTINPLFISIARVTERDGTVTDQASALFNYGAEMESALNGLLADGYKNWDFDRATWSGKVVDATSEAELAVVSDAPYKKRVAFSFPTDQTYKVKLKETVITVPSKDLDSASKLVVTIVWDSTPEKFWGNSIAIQHSPDFPTTIYFDNNNIKTNSVTPKKYDLVFGDDFNYHFNGLNYKSYSAYTAVFDSEQKDKEAYLYNSNWDPEPNTGFTPKQRHDASWDIRNTETKNGILLSKVLAQDSAEQTVFLGHNKTKPVSGFQDLVTGQDVMSGATRSKTVRFGYVEGKVRVKRKAYNDHVVRGPWYAFWLHGDMHEYDIMEFLGAADSRESQLVIHWHNGWTSFGSNPGSSWIKYNVPANYENEWWTLGLYWDEESVVYTYNGAEMLRLSRDSDNKNLTLRTKDPAWLAPGYPSSRSFSQSTSYDKDLNPQIGGGTTPIPYNPKRLKAIMDVPMNIFASTEKKNGGWGGSFNGNTGQFPTWLEVDYIAYYLPAAELQALSIVTDTSVPLVKDETLALSVGYIPSHTSDKGVTWSSEHPTVASVDPDSGVVTAVGQGTATIRATSKVKPSISVTTTVTVVDSVVEVQSIDLNHSSLVLTDTDAPVGLVATVQPAGATYPEVNWAVFPAGVVTVVNGLVTPVGLGTATVVVTSAKYPTIKAECVVTVKRATVSAPQSVLVQGVTHKLVKSFDFTEATPDCVLSPNATLLADEGFLQVKNQLGSDYKIGFALGTIQADTFAIRYKIKDFTPNFDFNFGTSSVPHYTFFRPVADIAVFYPEWNGKYWSKPSWPMPSANQWVTQTVTKVDRMITMTRDGDAISGMSSSPLHDSWSGNMELYLRREHGHGDNGLILIEYVAFYKKQ